MRFAIAKRFAGIVYPDALVERGTLPAIADVAAFLPFVSGCICIGKRERTGEERRRKERNGKERKLQSQKA